MVRSAPRRIGIVELAGRGHRLVYVAILAEYALESGDQVFFITSRRVTSQADYRVHVEASFPDIHVELLDTPDMQALKTLAERLALTDVVIPDSDIWLPRLVAVIPSKLPFNLTLLVMRDPTLPEIELTLSRLLRRAAKIAILRAIQAKRGPKWRVLKLKDPLPSLLVPGETAPDPVAPRPASLLVDAFRAELPSAGFWFGVVGSISARKSPIAIALGALESGLCGCGLALIGPQNLDASMKQTLHDSLGQLEAAGWKVFVKDVTLTDEEISVAIAAMDCVVVAYTNPHPPSTVSKSVALGTRTVVAGSRGTLGSAKQLGATVVTADSSPEGLSEALVLATTMDRPEPGKLLGRRDFAHALLG